MKSWPERAHDNSKLATGDAHYFDMLQTCSMLQLHMLNVTLILAFNDTAAAHARQYYSCCMKRHSRHNQCAAMMQKHVLPSGAVILKLPCRCMQLECRGFYLFEKHVQAAIGDMLVRKIIEGGQLCICQAAQFHASM